ncbi:MAG: DNA-processing protein DprA [Actinomycetota bacterium]
MTARTVTRASAEWPTGLDEMPVAQPVRQLFVEGNPLRTGERTVAVVGSRRPTAAGVEAAAEISRGLAEAGFEIVSGLAIGIDAAAHRAALDAGGYTIAVLGCGLDVGYPRKNADLRRRIVEAGTVLTEYEAGTQPHRSHFPDRNRIIAGMSKAVVFVEGADRSGGLITARHAVDANRDVYAVPGSRRNPLAAGPNELIRTGHARLVTSVEHVLEDLAPALVWGHDDSHPVAGDPAVNESEGRVLAFLDDRPTPLDDICTGLSLTCGEAALCLAALEVRGYVVKRPSGYELTKGGARVRARLPVPEE